MARLLFPLTPLIYVIYRLSGDAVFDACQNNSKTPVVACFSEEEFTVTGPMDNDAPVLFALHARGSTSAIKTSLSSTRFTQMHSKASMTSCCGCCFSSARSKMLPRRV